MNENQNLSELPSIPTYSEVLRDRSVTVYPRKKHDIIKSKKDRRDFLIAAYFIITHRKPDLFRHLLWISLHSRRVEFIKVVPKISTELSLMSILGKIISFDKKRDIIIPNDIELDDLLREMQRMFEPESIRPLPEISVQEAIPERLSGPGTFLGRPITNIDVLRILESIPVVEPEPAEQPTPVINKIPRREKPSLASVTGPVSAKISEQIKPKRPAPPQAPRRGDKPQHVWNRAWQVPQHVRDQIAAKRALTPQNSPEKKPSLPEVPQFVTKDEALAWVQNQPLLRQNYEVALQKKDDLALFAFIRWFYPFWARVFISIRGSFWFTTFHDILRWAFEFPVSQNQTLPVAAPQPKENISEAKPTIIPQSVHPEKEVGQLDISPDHEREIVQIFALHTAGNYVGFFESVKQLSPQIRHEIEQIRVAFWYSTIYHAIAYIAWSEFTAKDNNLYVAHNWHTRIRKLQGVEASLQALLKLGKDANKMSTILVKIKNVKIRVPNNIRELWHWFDEIGALEKSLLEVVQLLIQTAPWYKKNDEESTKKILRTIKQIMWMETPEAAE